MKIGNIEIDGKVILGPMAGITTLAYREFMKPFGVALSFSEMISDCGIDYGNHKTMEYFKTSKIDRPIGLQLFGSSIEHSIRAIKYLEENADYDILDLNLGCPVNKVTKTGAGSAWLKDPEGLFKYVSEIVKASSKPVTAKIRLGWDNKSINFKDITKCLESAGISAITIHSRTREQGYSGKANHQLLKDFRTEMSVPLIISGDIFTPEDAKSAIELTGADAVMVARGGKGNPFLIKQINQYLSTGTYDNNYSIHQQAEFAILFSKMLIKEKGERVAIAELRGILPSFFSKIPCSKEIRLKLSTSIMNENSLLNYLEALL